MDDEDNWVDVKGEIIYDRIHAKSKESHEQIVQDVSGV